MIHKARDEDLTTSVLLLEQFVAHLDEHVVVDLVRSRVTHILPWLLLLRQILSLLIRLLQLVHVPLKASLLQLDRLHLVVWTMQLILQVLTEVVAVLFLRRSNKDVRIYLAERLARRHIHLDWQNVSLRALNNATLESVPS